MPSKVIKSFAYEAPTRSLEITFTSGRRYRYHDVPPEVHERMLGAFSRGEFFNREIRDRFRYTAEP